MAPERQNPQSSVAAPAFAVDEAGLHLVDLALAEDRGAGDWTTRWVVPARARAHAAIVAKSSGVVAGLGVASAVFVRLDPRVEVLTSLSDGISITKGQTICTVKGPARAILTGERTALNFLQRLCGIAKLTRAYVDAVAGTNAIILDTRKTAPGWRALEKAAVRAGGGQNHRQGLYDMVLIKENHSEIAGSIAEAIKRVREANSKGLRVEVEVRDLPELSAALQAGCDRVLLDNMAIAATLEAVKVVKDQAPQVEIEASGNMTLDRVREVANTGVDYISVGALTHSAIALDLSLQLKSA